MLDEQPQEIIIVRRRVEGEDDPHHGGAWKIAYADFVTAMMAFFLVLWILDSTGKDSQTIVARYFNPVKMEDFAKNKKGIRESQKDEKPGSYDGEIERTPPPGPHEGKIEEMGKEPNKDLNAKSLMNEETLFQNPYAALDQIAGKVKERDKAQENRAKDNPGDDGAKSGGSPDEGGSTDGYRDPFRSAGAGADREDALAESEKAQSQAPLAPPSMAGPASGKAAMEAAEKAENFQAAELKKEIARAVKADAAQGAKGKTDASAGAPGLEVQATAEGLLISLTDSESFGMFEVGSSSPNPRLVHLMDRIAQSLKDQPGAIVLRGHTDARRYRGGTSDNWRLSASRAQMALYMLVRGGLPEARVERVEGYADRRLKIADKPEAAENRRIEILLRKAAP